MVDPKPFGLVAGPKYWWLVNFIKPPCTIKRNEYKVLSKSADALDDDGLYHPELNGIIPSSLNEIGSAPSVQDGVSYMVNGKFTNGIEYFAAKEILDKWEREKGEALAIARKCVAELNRKPLPTFIGDVLDYEPETGYGCIYRMSCGDDCVVSACRGRMDQLFQPKYFRPAVARRSTSVGRFVQKYGYSNVTVEILEKDVPEKDLNTLIRYYSKKFNSEFTTYILTPRSNRGRDSAGRYL